ncbi:hypothetical protein PG993_003858 [Apiospora rasikravindrae]|uniref:DUF4267 domain-containing protein n=1 Tax=Apiospora rasikravindrae TaxID=990691 RepID=A0ABR1U3F1_9PEZI
MSSTRTAALKLAAYIFATIFTGFGINALLRPDHALTFFAFSPPVAPADRRTVDSLMYVYGARDVFMGIAICAAAAAGTKRSLALTLLAASGVALVDGAACFAAHGQGHWNHWGYAPVVTVVGVLLLN